MFLHGPSLRLVLVRWLALYRVCRAMGRATGQHCKPLALDPANPLAIAVNSPWLVFEMNYKRYDYFRLPYLMY
jgi:hypothetical protein